MPAGFTPGQARALWPGTWRCPAMKAVADLRPHLYRSAETRAAAAAAGRFDLLGSGEVSVLDAGGGIRWHEDFKSGSGFPPDRFYLDLPRSLGRRGTDIKIPWELSRFQHVFAFIWAGPDRYAETFLRQWRDWMEANPVGRGVNWACAMEVALRVISWTAALACWWDRWDLPIRRAMWAALLDHGHFLRDNLEWGPVARGNHYYSDLVGLAVLGAVLAGRPPAEEWADFAARELNGETLRQFAPDGLTRECSTAYHRLMLELAVVGERACRLAGRPYAPAAMGRLEVAFRALAVLAGENGRMPLVGDNDSGRVFPAAWREDADVRYLYAVGNRLFDRATLPPAPVPPEVPLLFGTAELSETPAEPCRIASSLPDSGFFVLADERDRMVVRCGPDGYPPVGGHPHLDQLAIVLTVDGLEVLVDPGQFCYTPWPERSLHYRGTAAHNTLTVDGRPQAPVRVGAFGYCHASVGPLRSRCTRFAPGPNGAAFEGRHDGYRRLRGGADHLRAVRYDAARRRWTVRDRLDLTGTHRVRWHFHLHPAASASADGATWVLQRDAVRVVLRWEEAPSPGRVEPDAFSPAYGMELASAQLVFEAEANGAVDRAFELAVTSPAGGSGASGPRQAAAGDG